jgi:UDP-glucose 4-epimerase
MKKKTGSSLSRKRVLITGGLGFIGSNLARWLVDLDNEVILLDSLLPDGGGNLFNISGIENRVQIHRETMKNEEMVRKLVKDVEIVFNLAGQTSHLGSMQDSKADFEANTFNQLGFLQICRELNPEIKIIFTSTRQVYGHPHYLPVDELHPVSPVDYNGISKLAGELYHTVCGRIYGLHTTCLRLTNCFGPRMRVKDAKQSFIGWWLRQAIEGKKIPVFGNGNQIRDFNHVDDVVDALILCADNPSARGQTYNLGGESVALKDLAQLIVEVAGSGSWELVPFPPERKKIDIGDYQGDYKKIRESLEWQPRVSLSTGILETLDFYRLHRGEYW